MTDRLRERLQLWATPAIALLALASSAIGINNWYTYDDRYIVELNPATHSLHRWWTAFQNSYWPRDWGGDGYRPLTIMAYKIEYVLGRGVPVAFHATNIALYMLTAVLVYFLARRLLPGWAAWITAALFAVHPVHVEAVAGVVGQSELLVAAAVLAAICLYLRDRAEQHLRPRTALFIALLYAVACLSKEHGIVLPALLIAAELTIIDDRRPWRQRLLELRPFYLVLFGIAVIFVAIRSVVLADHGLGGFQPFVPFSALHSTEADRMLTALGVVPQWVRLFYWPAHLASEYGPPDISIAQGIALWQLPGFLLLGSILGLGVLLRKARPVISFGIAFVCIVLLPSSNFIIPAGIVLAERTLFLPSVGAMLVLGGVLVAVEERLRARGRLSRGLLRTAAVGAAVVLVTGAVRSEERTTVWKNNATLFNHAVLDAPNTYRAHYMLGAWDFENKQKRVGEEEYRKALALFPYDPFVAYTLAEQYRQVGLCSAALPLYELTRDIDPKFVLGAGSYAWCLLNADRFDEAKAQALTGMKFGANIRDMRRILFIADSVQAIRTKVPAAHGLLVRRPGNLPDSVQKTAVERRKAGAR